MDSKAKQEEQSLLLNMDEPKSNLLKMEYNRRIMKTKKPKSLRAHLRDIFPTKWLFFFFIFYTTIYVINAILVKYSSNSSNSSINDHQNVNSSSSKTSHSYSYDTVSTVLLTEVVKLVLNTLIFLVNGGSVIEYIRSIIRHRHMSLYYLIPSGLYGLYNNLTFVSLSVMDPATYYILLQFRIVVTAVIYKILFKRDLTKIQWISLALLTLGCIIKQWPASGSFVSAFNISSYSLCIITVQIFCSCFAGVYNEYLLKNKDENIKQVDLPVQNVYMYMDSIFVSLVFVFGRHMYDPNISISIDLSIFYQPLVCLIILVGALCGLSTSFFIKNFNSIMKSYAASLELALTAVICWSLFAIPITVPTIISICVVSYATYLFAKYPVLPK